MPFLFNVCVVLYPVYILFRPLLLVVLLLILLFRSRRGRRRRINHIQTSVACLCLLFIVHNAFNISLYHNKIKTRVNKQEKMISVYLM